MWIEELELERSQLDGKNGGGGSLSPSCSLHKEQLTIGSAQWKQALSCVDWTAPQTSRHVTQGISEDKIQAEPEQPDGLDQLVDPDEHLLLPRLVNFGLALGQRENSLVVAAILLGNLLAGERLPGVDQEECGQAGAAGGEVRAAQLQLGQGGGRVP